MTQEALGIWACVVQEATSHSDHAFPVLPMVGLVTVEASE